LGHSVDHILVGGRLRSLTGLVSHCYERESIANTCSDSELFHLEADTHILW